MGYASTAALAEKSHGQDWEKVHEGSPPREQYFNRMDMGDVREILPSFDHELYQQVQQRGCYDSDCSGAVLWLAHEYRLVFREMKKDPLTIPRNLVTYRKYEIVLREYIRTGDCKKAMLEQEI